jgi:transcriptional regulator of acetoin/glycerol metabolism
MADEHDADHRSWEEAVRREAAISDLVGRHPDRLTVGAVDQVASELGLSRATVYRMVERFRARGHSVESTPPLSTKDSGA